MPQKKKNQKKNPIDNLKVGDEVMISAKGKIIKISDAHGLCFQIELPVRDYNHKRIIFVDEDEITMTKEHYGDEKIKY